MSFYQIALVLFLALCFPLSIHGLMCYTCDSDLGRDGNTIDVDSFCEKGVTASPNLLTACESGKNAVCSTVSYTANRPGSKLKIFRRSCHYASTDMVTEGCVSMSSGIVLEDNESRDYSPTASSKLGFPEAPFHVCFCKADGCNSEDNYSNVTSDK